MKLNSRQIQLLRSVARSANGIALEAVSEAHGISQRTIYYDIKTINDFCATNDLGVLRVVDRHIVGSVDWERAWQLLSQLLLLGSGAACHVAHVHRPFERAHHHR